jgi:hypothetical protein
VFGGGLPELLDSPVAAVRLYHKTVTVRFAKHATQVQIDRL